MHPATRFQISVITPTEFLERFESTAKGERLVRNLRWIPVDNAIARQTAAFRRSLRLSGRRIGDFDLLIGSTAFVMQLPLVTNNEESFHRLEGLTIINYRAAADYCT
ncbi:MAG: hypothetical protein JJU00_15560 [Opitutales bacterium]|nr:hypothetical protein [Opitutales bacterium]